MTKNKPQIIENPEWKPREDSIITVGAFDGIHAGHRMILERLISEGRTQNLKSILFTFEPHPKKVLFPEKKHKLLTIKEEKIHLLKDFALDYVVFYPFTPGFSRMTGEEFLVFLKEKYRLKKLLLGYNHSFGSDRLQDDKFIKQLGNKLGFAVERLPRVTVDGIPVSSTIIKQRIEAYDILTANKLLAHPYLLFGRVVEGSKFGRKIGFPTANLAVLSEDKLIPPEGVYLVEVEWGTKRKFGVMNIGRRPTVDGRKRTLEVHILDFSGDIYGEIIHVYFLSFLRKEKNFQDVENLKKQIEKDVLHARRIILNFSK